MTVKLSVSLPDDVAAWLAKQPNTSAAVASAIRAQVGAAELASQRRRDAAAQYHAAIAALPPEAQAEINEATDASNALAYADAGADAEW